MDDTHFFTRKDAMTQPYTQSDIHEQELDTHEQDIAECREAIIIDIWCALDDGLTNEEVIKILMSQINKIVIGEYDVGSNPRESRSDA